MDPFNTTDAATNGFYVIMFRSEACKLHDNTRIDGQIITAGELVVIAQYFCSVQVNTYCCWDKHPQHHVITVTTRTILHPLLEFNEITDIHEIHKSVCTRTQEKSHIKKVYMSYWFWLLLHLRRNLSLRQNWVWNICRSL